MKVVMNIITFALIFNYGVLVEVSSQRSGIGLINAALTKRDSILDSAGAIIKQIMPSSSNDTGTSEDVSTTDQTTPQPEGKVNSTENDTITGLKVPDVTQWFGYDNTPNGTRIPNIFATKSVQDYIDEALKPVQKSAADVVEGAVKTGVDQAMSSLTDNFKIDVYLVGAVLVIQVVLCACGAHLFYYVYQREREMRSYVKQQIGMSKMP